MRKFTMILAILALMLSLAGCSDSSSSYGQQKKNNDRHFDNQEITDFVNSYDGKW